MAIEDKNSLLKEAADALELAHRKDRATKLAFQLVEKGKVPPFRNELEFREKVASLLGKDLDVMREAIELDGSVADLGKVASDAGRPTDPTMAFFHTLAND